jgi:hypothetical protein
MRLPKFFNLHRYFECPNVPLKFFSCLLPMLGVLLHASTAIFCPTGLTLSFCLITLLRNTCCFSAPSFELEEIKTSASGQILKGAPDRLEKTQFLLKNIFSASFTARDQGPLLGMCTAILQEHCQSRRKWGKDK